MKKAIAACLGALLASGISVRTADAVIAAQEYGWYGYYAGESDGGGGTKCGTGTKTLCQTIKKTTCTHWQNTSGTFGGSPNGGTIGLGTTCANWIESTVYKYYP